MPDQRLTWRPGFTLARKPVRRSIPRRNQPNTSRQFVFVTERPARDRETRFPTPLSSSPATNDMANSNLPGTAVDNYHLSPENSEIHLFSYERKDDDIPVDEEIDIHFAISNEDLTRSFENKPDLSPALATTNTPDFQASIPPRILFNSILDRFRPVLERYNNDFCKIPLTSDLRSNPFQYRTDINPEPIFLIHAVMALSGHHVNSLYFQDHRHIALRLLRQDLMTYSIQKDVFSLLDAIVILFSLDESQSALGNWRTHLLGAYSLLEASGGIQSIAMTPRTEVQIALLTWWDAITSLVSREDCIFPYAYYEAVLLNHDDQEWDFFGLCGCPARLASIVMQLARLSAEKQKASSMQYVKFDTAIVVDLQQALVSWDYLSTTTAMQDEEDVQKDFDNMHCSEAWRNGLLIYIYRVFFWEPGSSVPMHLMRRARTIVNHVVACREESMITRQALLPLFFAGCELRDSSLRKKVLSLCYFWNQHTRYNMFSTTIPLLKEVWADQQSKGFENVWWGQIIDRRHKAESCHPLPRRICFG